MVQEIKAPKFVKPANMWCVTILDKHAKKGGQFERHWFSTLKEAEEFSDNWEAPKDDDSGN